jgi:threonine/homoserine/homoserine lactone efflux protein
MPLDTWLTFAAASFVLLIIPGPTILLVLSYALSQGKRVAIASASGVALGDFTAMSASLAGLGALIMASATAFTVLKWIGAVYLVWMGVKLLRSARAQGLALPDAPGSLSAMQVFRDAAIVTALNPKPIAFFLAFVPQFIDQSAPLAPQFAILVATFVSLGALNALAYALLADRLRGLLTGPGATLWLTRAGGGTLIAMGLMTATLKRAHA